MIKRTKAHIMKELPKNSVVIYQANCQGYLQQGLMTSIQDSFENWYQDYHGYCKWFMGGHEDEILGTFHRFDAKPGLILCGAFVQLGLKGTSEINFDAWERILRKIELQTQKINKGKKNKWTLHIQSQICGKRNPEAYEKLHDLIKQYFRDSPVEIWIHTSDEV